MRMKRRGVLELLEQDKPLKICAPMVRYSKLQFRHLVRKWGADVAFSPMITADSFTKSAKARAADFSTDSGERNEDCHGILSALSDYVSTQQTITLLWSSSVLVLHHFSLKLQNMLRSKQQEKQSVDHERPIFVVVSAMGLTSTVDVLKVHPGLLEKTFQNMKLLLLVLETHIFTIREAEKRWAIGEKIGGYLLSRPDIIQDMISQLRNRIPNPSFTKSIKIRINDDLVQSVDLCRQMEAAGASFLTVHGRTLKQKSDPANWNAIRIIKESVNIPVFANGDIKTPADMERVLELTGVDGVMAANGLLVNPALFSGHDVTPTECIQDWLAINEMDTSCPFRIFHHHLIWMTEKLLTKHERIKFSDLLTKEDVLNFIEDRFMVARSISDDDNVHLEATLE